MSKIKLIFGVSCEREKKYEVEVDAGLSIAEAQKCALAKVFVDEDKSVDKDKKEEFRIFFPGVEKPADLSKCIRDMADGKKIIVVHVGRCLEIHVTVDYNTGPVKLKVSPGETVSEVRAKVLEHISTITSKDGADLYLFEKKDAKDSKLPLQAAIGCYAKPDCTLTVYLSQDDGFAG